MQERKVLKSKTVYEGYKLELVEVGLDRFEILVNGELRATEYDYSRACETFNQLEHN